MRVLATIATSIAVTVLAVSALRYSSADAAIGGSSPAQQADSPCVVTHTKSASPSVLLLGEEVTVTMAVQASCPDAVGAMHIVLALDGSGSMQGQKHQQMKQGAARFIRGLDLPNHPAWKVGVVEFNSQARRLCSLTNNENQAVGCVNRVGANGGTRIDLGIMEGLRVLSQGRSGINRNELTEVLIVLSDGANDAGCQPALTAAAQAKGGGVLVIAVCVGDECDEACMRQIASSPRHFYHALDAGQIQAVFQSILDSLLGLALRELKVTDVFGDSMAFVPDSAEPPHTEPDDPQTWLEWEDVFLPSGPYTYSLRLKPGKPGNLATNAAATGELTDVYGRTKTWVFEVPRVTVLGPDPLPTGPTVTSTHTPTPVATVTPTPTVAATPSAARVFLPKALNLDMPCPDWVRPFPRPSATPPVAP